MSSNKTSAPSKSRVSRFFLETLFLCQDVLFDKMWYKKRKEITRRKKLPRLYPPLVLKPHEE